MYSEKGIVWLSLSQYKSQQCSGTGIHGLACRREIHRIPTALRPPQTPHPPPKMATQVSFMGNPLGAVSAPHTPASLSLSPTRPHPTTAVHADTSRLKNS